MIDTQTKQKELYVGQRIQHQDQFGTIRYVGEVEGYKGNWCGIDWDDPTRGKHNGSVNGKHYFNTCYTTSGSFLRPEKVETGIGIIESIVSRYGQKDYDSIMKLNEQELTQLEHLWNAPFCKLVGFDKVTTKQSNYKDLTVLNLRKEHISNLGEPMQVANMCPNVVELDISNTLINTWEEVFNLASELENLQVLNVSTNKLVMPSDTSKFKIPQLQTLACGSMNLTWNDIKILSSVFTNIEHIYAPNNLITTMEYDANVLSNLKTLDISGNLIDNWNEIMMLKDLPLLDTLNIGSLKIKAIQINNSSNFENLEKLIVKHNLIDNWKSLSELNKLKKLKSLSLSGNPLYELMCEDMLTQIVIAMIASLEYVNNIYIYHERKGAEIDYLKKFAPEWLKAKQSPEIKEEFLNVHTRYLELINKYGEVEECELKEQAKTIEESLINITLQYENRLIQKRVPPSMLIQKLSMLSQRLFRLSTSPKLVYISQHQPGIEYELDEAHELSLYSVQSNDTIIVNH